MGEKECVRREVAPRYVCGGGRPSNGGVNCKATLGSPPETRPILKLRLQELKLQHVLKNRTGTGLRLCINILLILR